MTPVKGVKRPKGVIWLVPSEAPAPRGGESELLRRDTRQPLEDEVREAAIGPPESITELQASYRAKGIETKRASSEKDRDVLVAYIPKGEYQTPNQQFVEEAKSFFSHLLRRRR